MVSVDREFVLDRANFSNPGGVEASRLRWQDYVSRAISGARSGRRPNCLPHRVNDDTDERALSRYLGRLTEGRNVDGIVQTEPSPS